VEEVRMKRSVDLILEAHAMVAETPFWDPEERVVYWTDLAGKSVHVYNPASGEGKAIGVKELTGTVIRRKSGGVIVALENSIIMVDIVSESVTPLLVVERGFPENRLNDGKCDAKGRLWISSAPKEFAQHGMALKPTGKLYCVDTDFHVTVHDEIFHMYNGIAWNTQSTKMYVADTANFRILSFDFDLETGTISNKETFVDVPRDFGYPDGMCMDVENNIWLAHWGGSQITSWNTRTSKLLKQIKVPAPFVTCCAFVGDNLDELYITSAMADMDEAELVQYPSAGGIFRLKTSVSGMPTSFFGG
jgi:sugar lactone lactonase YvrE